MQKNGACGHCRGYGCQNENSTKNVANDICEESNKRNIFDIFNLLDT